MAKKEEFVPTDLVKRFYNEGKGETEVIMQLRSQGFTPSQIDRAMKAVPKPAHAPKPLPVEARPREEYRGPLPKEMIRPIAKAAPPEQRFAAEPLEETEMGSPPEKIEIPDDLKPIELTAPKQMPKPVHQEKPTPQQKPFHEEHAPAPMQPGKRTEFTQSHEPAQTGGTRISLEELVEQIVAEQEKKIRSDFNELHTNHEANAKKINALSAKDDLLTVDVRALQKMVDDKSTFSGDANKALAIKVEALETAFKELAHFLHKK